MVVSKEWWNVQREAGQRMHKYIEREQTMGTMNERSAKPSAHRASVSDQRVKMTIGHIRKRRGRRMQCLWSSLVRGKLTKSFFSGTVFLLS